MFESDWDRFLPQEATTSNHETNSTERRLAKKRSHNGIQDGTKNPPSMPPTDANILLQAEVDISRPEFFSNSIKEAELSFAYYAYVDTVCRTCLQKLDNGVSNASTTNSYHPIFQTTNLAKKLSGCTSLKIEQADKYPKNVCNSCFNKVNEFYQFQSMCVESMQQFCQMFLVSGNSTTFDTVVPRIKTEFVGNDTLESEMLCGAMKIAGQPQSFGDSSKTRLESDQQAVGEPNRIVQCSLDYCNDDLLLHSEKFDFEKGKEIRSTNSKTHKDGKERMIQTKMNELLRRHREILKIVADNNFLLRQNLGISSVSPIKFPIETEDKLEELEARLAGESKAGMVGILRRVTGGKIDGVDAIFGKQIVMDYNYNGEKGKKPLKSFNNCLNALYEATYEEGRTFDEFVNNLRQHLKKVKNRFNKRKSRMNNH